MLTLWLVIWCCNFNKGAFLSCSHWVAEEGHKPADDYLGIWKQQAGILVEGQSVSPSCSLITLNPNLLTLYTHTQCSYKAK